jgi:hypothetical protein
VVVVGIDEKQQPIHIFYHFLSHEVTSFVDAGIVPPFFRLQPFFTQGAFLVRGDSISRRVFPSPPLPRVVLLKLCLAEGHLGNFSHGAGKRVPVRIGQQHLTRPTSLGHLRHKRRVDLQAHLADLFALVVIGLFVVVPKTDAKPHLFITLS